jgi:hypothetical protein
MTLCSVVSGCLYSRPGKEWERTAPPYGPEAGLAHLNHSDYALRYARERQPLGG